MQASDLLTTALTFTANSSNSVVILKRCGPHWLLCTDSESQVRRFTAPEGQYVDSFDLSVKLPTIFQSLLGLVSPADTPKDQQEDNSKTVREIINIEEFEPRGQHRCSRITLRDLKSAEPDQCLNDTVINEYIDSMPKSPHVTISNTYFHARLLKNPAKVGAAFDPFQTKFALIPVHDNGLKHWLLMVLCNMQSMLNHTPPVDQKLRPCIAVLDSLRGSCGPSIANSMLDYLVTLVAERTTNGGQPEDSYTTSREVRIVMSKVPQQANGHDCGVFLLHFVKTFLGDPDYYCRVILENTDAAAWESETPISDMRTHIRTVIRELYAQTESSPTGVSLPDALPKMPTSITADTTMSESPVLLRRTSSRLSSAKSEPDKGKGKAVDQAITRPENEFKRSADSPPDRRPRKRPKVEEPVEDADASKTAEDFWYMIDRARRCVEVLQTQDLSDSPGSSSTLGYLVERAARSDKNVRVANNANLICYLQLGREVNRKALEMGRARAFKTKANGFVNDISNTPWIKNRRAAQDMLARAKWVYALFRDIPENVIGSICGFTVKDAARNWPVAVRLEIATGKRAFNAVDAPPCWISE